MDELINKYINIVAYSTGFDVNDADNKVYLTALIKAGIADMKKSGVPEEVILTNDLVLTTLIIFVTDNTNMTPGSFVLSQLYIHNVAKLRMNSYVS